MADSPTQHAQMNFNDAYREFMPLYSSNSNPDMVALGSGLAQLANGLNQLSKGLRAVYMKLEEIEKRQNMPR
jgi:X-X-X-Leu-X-X-Gly heptad repeat protein